MLKFYLLAVTTSARGGKKGRKRKKEKKKGKKNRRMHRCVFFTGEHLATVIAVVIAVVDSPDTAPVSLCSSKDASVLGTAARTAD